MTEFADLFSAQIDETGDSIMDTLEEFERRDSYSRIKEEISKRIFDAPDEERDSPSVIAVDAGRNSVSLRNNQYFYVTQASAVDSQNENSRSLKTGVARPFNGRAFSRMKSHASELCELEAVNRRIEETEIDGRKFILIDGSLITRMMPVPEELDISNDADVALDVIEEFSRLLEKVKGREDLVLVGVSKDSNSSLLNRAVIEKMEEQTLKEMEETGSDLAEIHRQGVPDTALLDWETNGYTQPVMMGATSRRFRSRMNSFMEDREAYCNRHFRNSERAREVLEKIMDYPGIASFYWMPGDDQPVRIDLLSSHWTEDRLLEIEDRNFVEKRDIVEEVIEMLETGYAGRERHNIWISMADSQASLSRGEMENVYMPIMSQRLGINLRKYRRRRDRRV